MYYFPCSKWMSLKKDVGWHSEVVRLCCRWRKAFKEGLDLKHVQDTYSKIFKMQTKYQFGKAEIQYGIRKKVLWYYCRDGKRQSRIFTERSGSLRDNILVEAGQSTFWYAVEGNTKVQVWNNNQACRTWRKNSSTPTRNQSAENCSVYKELPRHLRRRETRTDSRSSTDHHERTEPCNDK